MANESASPLRTNARRANRPHRLAFRAPNWLGDAVMSSVIPPTLAEHAQRQGIDRHLTVFAPRAFAELFESVPGVDAVVPFDRETEVHALRSGEYDSILLGPQSFGVAWRSLRAGIPERLGVAISGRKMLLTQSLAAREATRHRHQVDNYLALTRLCGVDPSPRVPRIPVRDEWRRGLTELWPASGKRRVVLQPGATYGPAKRWPAERFATLAKVLRDDGFDVAVLGGEKDRDVVEDVLGHAPGMVSLLGKTTVGELAALLESADVLVTNDTGPMHLAAAVGTRVVALFGSTNPTWTGPSGNLNLIVSRALPCAPCYQRACNFGAPCLEGIQVDEVKRATLEILAREVS